MRKYATLVVHYVTDEFARAWCVPNEVLTYEDRDVFRRLDGATLPAPNGLFPEDVRESDDFKTALADLQYLRDKAATTWSAYACPCIVRRVSTVHVGDETHSFILHGNIEETPSARGWGTETLARKIATEKLYIGERVAVTETLLADNLHFKTNAPMLTTRR